MKTRILLLAIIMSSISLYVEAQFSKTYKGNESRRGFDIIESNGRYYFSYGNRNKKILFEVDPITGTKVGNVVFSPIGNSMDALTDVGKNSLALITNPNPNLNELIHTGTIGVTSKLTPKLKYYHIRDTYSTIPISPKFIETNWVGFEPFNDSSGYFNEFVTYSDQALITKVDPNVIEEPTGDYIYFTGLTSIRGLYSDQHIPYIMRARINGNTTAPIMKTLTPLGGIETPSSIFTHKDHHNVYVSYSAFTLNQQAGEHPQAGIWATDWQLNTQFSKVYSTSDEVINPLGMAKSVIHQYSTSGGNTPSVVFIAGGSDPALSESSFGKWDKDYFHVVKVNSNDGSVILAKKFNFYDMSIDDRGLDLYSHLQVSDIVEDNGNGFIVTGSMTHGINEGDFLTPIEKVFIMYLDYDLNVLQVLQHELVGTPGNTIYEMQVNRIRIINSEIFITAAFSYDSDPTHFDPLLIKLGGSCYTQIGASSEEVTLIETYHHESQNLKAQEHNTNISLGYEAFFDEQELCNVFWESKNNPQNSITTDINEANTSNKVSVFPTPSKNKITISGLSETVVTISTIDITGKIMKEYTLEGSENYQIDISDLETGVYILNVLQSNHNHTIKLIKE